MRAIRILNILPILLSSPPCADLAANVNRLRAARLVLTIAIARGELAVDANSGRFEWVRRMGVHEAYHKSTVNRIIHWICIPFELFAVVKLLSLVRIESVGMAGYPLDLAWLVIAVVAFIYLLTEILAGLLMTAALVGLHILANQISTGTIWIDALGALGLFILSFSVQTQIGHRIFEKGIDDTEKNLAEFGRTKNPVPLLLIFYYHLVEILFAIGYRPSLKKSVGDFNAAETREIAKSRK